MLQRRYNSSVRFFPRTLLAWVALALVAVSTFMFWLAFQAGSGVGPIPSFVTGVPGIALAITMGVWRKDISILLGILASVCGTLMLTLALAFIVSRPA